jgi:type I restriction enzyme, S subunit
MTEGGDIDKLGRGCMWLDQIAGCLHQNHVFAVRCKQDLLMSEFLVGLMVSQHGRVYFQLTAKQTTNLASTNSTTLKAFPIILPPVVEQRAILDQSAKQMSDLDAAISRADRQITLLREYRTRLIADVVTGKLDVREAAARLTHEAGEPDALDETEDFAQENEVPDDIDALSGEGEA